MGLSHRTLALLAFGTVGWLILFIALAGGCDKTRTLVETVVETETLATDTTTESGAFDTTEDSVDTTGDSVSLAVLDSRGRNDPVEDVGRVLDFTTESAADAYLYVTHRPAGGAQCAPTYDADSGTGLIDGESITAGSSEVRQTTTWEESGRYLFCMWIANSSDDPNGGSFSQIVKFRQPHGRIRFLGPSSVSVNRAAALRFRGISEAPKYLFVSYRNAGGSGCAPTYYSDSGNTIIEGANANGGFNETDVYTFESRGTYLICAWLADSGDDTQPVAIRSFGLRVG
jgi:hypothetical protein